MTNATLMPLWDDPAPGALGNGPLDVPALSTHLPDPSIANGAGVLVCPGGGYRVLASDHEGLQVARWLNRVGIAAYVLRYRLGERYHSEASLLDGQRAMRSIRDRAAQDDVDPNRIGMLGFSAGGHLTANVGTRWDHGDPSSSDPVERESCRPDFLVPVYAVVNGVVRGRKADEYVPADPRVDATTPPAFVMHTHEDSIVPANQALLFYDALRRAGVQSELHVFGYGEHGAGLGAGDPDLAAWPDLLHNWMRRSGFLTPKPRFRLTGRITAGGAPLGMCWVTFRPHDPNAPLARQKFNRTSDGHFEISAVDGPTAGPHTCEVHYLSDRYPHAGDGAYTLEDSRSFTCEALLADGDAFVWDVGAT